MMRARRMLIGALLLFCLLAGALVTAAPDPGIRPFLDELYQARSRALITGEAAAGLDRFYDLNAQSSRFALAHETGRITYMQAWAVARGLKVTEAENILTNLRVKAEGDQATVSLIVRTRLAYQYESHPGINQMGVGSWHWLQLVRRDGTWQVAKEYYLDAMGDEWTLPYSAPSAPRALSAEPVASRGRLDRPGVVSYAEEYCGAAWGCGNRADYNQRYQSYRHLGGDCANFASQALVEGGGLKPDWTWRHDKAGSTCWVNAQAFIHYLANSGRATVLARGTYPSVEGALSKLKPGDIIGYQSGSKGITHVSVVTGIDLGGTPVVAAHTADRFRNPWDLGWGKKTVFWLLHIHD